LQKLEEASQEKELRRKLRDGEASDDEETRYSEEWIEEVLDEVEEQAF